MPPHSIIQTRQEGAEHEAPQRKERGKHVHYGWKGDSGWCSKTGLETCVSNLVVLRRRYDAGKGKEKGTNGRTIKRGGIS